MSENNTNSYVVSTDGLRKDIRHHILGDKNYKSKTDELRATVNQMQETVQQMQKYINEMGWKNGESMQLVAQNLKSHKLQLETLQTLVDKLMKAEIKDRGRIERLEKIADKGMQAMNGRTQL